MVSEAGVIRRRELFLNYLLVSLCTKTASYGSYLRCPDISGDIFQNFYLLKTSCDRPSKIDCENSITCIT